MDRPLSADRRDYSSEPRRDNYYGPGGGGGYRRGGGRDRGGFRGGRGRHRDYHHQPYNSGGNYNNRGRGGGPRPVGNRFQADQQQPYDPKQAAVRQLLQLLTQVGAFQIPVAAVGSDNKEASSPEEATTSLQQRPVVAAQAKNIQALTNVLCGSKADIFLQYEQQTYNTPSSADKIAGPFAAGLVHCQAVWPLQTPCYAALTLAVHEHAAVVKTLQQQPFGGSSVGQRCLEYTTKLLARDLDLLLLEEAPAESSSADKMTRDRPRAVVRLRLTLRYLALLAATGMVAPNDTDPWSGNQAAVLAATNLRPLSVAGLLDALVQAAIQAATERYQTNKPACYVLALLVWSTIPYVRGFLSSDWIMDHLILPLEEIMEGYQSNFAPGVGSLSILLKAERHEDVGEGLDENDEDDDEEEEEASNQVCDSFQDLMRTIKHFLKDDTAPCRFALFTDAPWKDLKAPAASTETKEGENQAMGDDAPAAPAPTALCYTGGEPMSLQIFPICKSLSLLLGGEVPPNTQLARINLNGIIFGRLPFFGPPPEAADDDDEEDEDMEDDAPVNERLHLYKTGFGMVDRFFLGEAVRDCILSHEGRVTDAGVQHGSVRGIAEQIWSLIHVLKGENASGVEYCILEVILSLIVQCERGFPLRLVYLSQVLLELTRMEPAIISPAIALGVSTLFQDYMPALVPMAGYNLSRWFAFHLTNTDYQWPAGYWKHWEPFVLYGWSNSRGAFVKGALALMFENLSNPQILVEECLPKESAIAAHLLPTQLEPLELATLSSMEDEIRRRMWDNAEDADSLLSYLVSDEMSESIAGALVQAMTKWGRTTILVRSLVSPVSEIYSITQQAIDKARSAADPSDAMEDSEDAKDALSLLLGKIEQYQNALRGVMAKDTALLEDAGTIGSETESRSMLAELWILQLLAGSTAFSRSIFTGCIDALLQHQIVQVSSVLKWCLGETADGSKASPVLRWWEIVNLAVQYGISRVMSEDNSSKNEMVVEGEEAVAESPSKQTDVLNYLDPLLSYMIQRVSSLLLESTSEKPNKLTPEQVELTEGFKYVALDCQNLYFSLMDEQSERSGQKSSCALHEALTESAIAGPNLASLMDAGGSIAADMLRQSLERL